MASRLDRLFILLETGTNAATKRAAAQQLGEAQRLHPHELHHLLARVSTLLKSSQWDTRVSAAHAVQAILAQVPQWSPEPLKRESCANNANPCETTPTNDRLSLENFDMSRVLAKSSHLTGSEGTEYDLVIAEGEQNPNPQHNEKLLVAKLGLDPRIMGMDTAELFTAEDLAPPPSTTIAQPPPITKVSIDETLRQQQDELSGGLSRREMNRAKRKARQSLSKQRSRDPEDPQETPNKSNPHVANNTAESMRKKIKLQESTLSTENSKTCALSSQDTGTSTITGTVPDVTGDWPETAVDWPLESFGETLCQDLFSQKWEVRHGAATALRELIRLHGKGAGKSKNQTLEQMNDSHRRWIMNAALRLLCVLGLDRFGDFVSDQVVAPVRETCAQALGSLVTLMENDENKVVTGVLNVTLKLLEHDEWEARHGAFLAMKYLLAVRDDLLDDLLPQVFPAAMRGLADQVDDVGAAAASALIPVASVLPRILKPEQLQTIVARLWELLREQDDLAAACNSFMGLLAAIISLPSARACLPPQPLSQVLPRLWPFLSHSSSSVRKATLQTLQTLTSDDGALTADDPKERWCDEGSAVLQEALRHVFQRVLIEHVAPIQIVAERVWENLVTRSDLEMLLHAACPLVGTWLCLAMQPENVPFNPTLLNNGCAPLVATAPKPIPKDATNGDSAQVSAQDCSTIVKSSSELKIYIGGIETVAQNVRMANTTRARCMAARVLGLLSRYVVHQVPGVIATPDIPSPAVCYARVLLAHLASRSALQRTVVGLTMVHWATLEHPNPPEIPDILRDKLLGCLNECVYYDEIAGAFTRLLHDSRDYIATLKHYKLALPVADDGTTTIMTLEQISTVAAKSIGELQGGRCCNTASGVGAGTNNALPKIKPKLLQSLDERRRALENGAAVTAAQQQACNVMSMAALAGAATMFHCLPQAPRPLNPLVKPLMEAIKREDNEDLQIIAAKNLAHLVDLCTDRNPSPNTKITTNLCTFLCSDVEFTPRLTERGDADPFDGILTLYNRQRNAERVTYNRGAGYGLGGVRGPGRPPVPDIPLEELLACEEPEAKASRTRRRGATLALDAIAKLMGPRLPERLPHLWKLMILNNRDTEPEKITIDSTHDSKNFESIRESVNNLVHGLQVLEIVGPSLHSSLLQSALECLPNLCRLLAHRYKVVRHMAARCISTMADLDVEKTMEHVVRSIIPLLEVRLQSSEVDLRELIDPNDYDVRRQGASEALTCIVENLGVRVVPYAVLFMIPLLGRMSDQNMAVRLACSSTLATLVQLLPLDAGSMTDPPNLVVKKAQERHFLEQLLNPQNIPDTKLTVKVAAELRSYQQQGLNWLDFLNRYHLHGVLCDDMGLGKTLQTLCILALDHHRNPKSPPSLVICPPTLTGHWVYETEKFITSNDLSVIQYAGNRAEREKLQPRVTNYRLVVASYEIMRKEIDFFQSVQWNYCVLDEGHIIKNGKTKSAQAAKKLRAHHRLILSGTPVQNHVLELWSLFDFLMPGFLGSEKQFSAKYSKPILACREPKAGPKDQEAGALAMEALRRQVLPFLLRRNKEDVLKDLPPKITQDYYCDLSSIQRSLYEDFRTRHTPGVIGGSDPPAAKSPESNVFMALRYLRNVCNHPKLVLNSRHPQYQAVCAQMKQQQTSLTDIEIAAKLPALKQLLLDCGIGQTQSQSSSSSQRLSKNCGTTSLGSSLDVQQNSPTQELVGQHRALIFCQLRAMLDIVEKDLLAVHLPSVTYLRLDGSVPSAQQTAIVARFNSDPSIDVLLLTTQIGGLGLNLTGADTVIFVEHDWNPMKDLQAMDRAHRIGQKKVVNVYRLITRCTVEEKIMSLQKFKLHTANTVITTENSSLATMVTDQLLDLFSLDNKKDGKPNDTSGSKATSVAPGVSKSVLEILPELWEQQQYDDEYDLDSFVSSLKSSE